MLQKDFEFFSKNLKNVLDVNKSISFRWLYGRDLDSANWYCKIFGKKSEIGNSNISRSAAIDIIESQFDWAGLLNKYKRMGVEYYENLELSKGTFFNLVIHEVSGKDFSLYDIDETEKLILDHLSNPMSIDKLLKRMQCYDEESVLQHHLEIFNQLIIDLIKQLVVRKAIKPDLRLLN